MEQKVAIDLIIVTCVDREPTTADTGPVADHPPPLLPATARLYDVVMSYPQHGTRAHYVVQIRYVPRV